MSQTNKFSLLRVRKILDILDGDKTFGSLIINEADSGIQNSMPYLTCHDLCDISNRFGLDVEYRRKGGIKSRWEYLSDLLSYCIHNNRESDLLCYFFEKEHFLKKLRGQTTEVIDSAYTQIVDTVIREINRELALGRNELVRLGESFVIRSVGTPVFFESSYIRVIDRAYIVKIYELAKKDVLDGNYDGAITKSRTLLEEVFCYVIEKKGETPSDRGDIGKLYNQVKDLYHMHQNKDMDKRINGLLSGLEKILSAIAEMRNIGSDSHGLGAKRINISEHHACLSVNSALTMADFILSVSNNVSC